MPGTLFVYDNDFIYYSIVKTDINFPLKKRE